MLGRSAIRTVNRGERPTRRSELDGSLAMLGLSGEQP